MTNREIAQEISNRIGTAPVPFDSVYSIALQIYHELGGEENQFDSVYSILLEILPLVEGGIKPIEEVNELPEASENKDKLFRLDNGNKDVYAAKLLSSKTITTNRLPDEQQIDKAYLSEAGVSVYYYKGSYTITCSDGVLNWYLWDRDVLKFATSENAVNSTSTTPCIMVDSESEYWSDVTETGATTTMTMQEVEEDDVVVGNGEVIPAIYNAPESAQIGNATLVDENSTIQHIYTGEEIIITVDGNETVVYKWQNTENPNEYVATDKKASEIYYTGDYPNLFTDVKIYDLNISPVQQTTIYELNIPQLNAPDSEQVGNATIKYNMGGNIFTATYDGTLTTLYDSIKDVSFTGYKWTTNSDEFITIVKAEELYSNAGTFSFMRQDGSEVADAKEGVTEVNTVKYQRTETIEEWNWQDITPTYASDSDIDDLFAAPSGNIIKLIRYQDAEQQASGFVDMLVNTSGETMEYNGQTYYKWVSWYNNPDAGISEPIEDTTRIMLTNTLDITLPFNTNSSEFEYVITYDEIGNIFADTYIKGDYTQKTVQ